MTWQIPGIAEIEAFRSEADKFIDSVTSVLELGLKYGDLIPGLGDKLKVVQAIEDDLKAAKAFMDHIPL